MSRLDEVNRHALPPHSIDAEHSILGGLLIAGESAWDEIAGIVEEADFYLDSHRRIFSHIRRLMEISSPVDIITVSDAIEKSNEFDQTGGLAYLAEIAGSTPSTSNIAGYAKVVKERAQNVMRCFVVNITTKWQTPDRIRARQQRESTLKWRVRGATQ